MVCAEKFSMSVGSALFIVKNYKSSQEHGSHTEAKPDSTIYAHGIKVANILLDPKLQPKEISRTRLLRTHSAAPDAVIFAIKV